MCDQCDNTELKEEYLKRHKKFNHDGFCYNCVMNVTLHQSITIVLMKVYSTNVITNVAIGNLKKHYLAEHEMVWYPCDKLVASSHCDYHATSKSSRGKHIKSVHEGIKYPCPQCDYQASLKGALRRHIQSTHEGIKISLSSL